MIRMSVYYPSGPEATFDHAYYAGPHRQLVEARLGPGGLQRIELDRGLAELLPLTLRARGVEEDRFRLVHADALQVTELPALPRAGEPTMLIVALGGTVAIRARPWRTVVALFAWRLAVTVMLLPLPT